VPRVAPILLLARNIADTDPEMASPLQEVDQAKLTRMEHNAQDLVDRGSLRDGVTPEQARDVLWTYSSAEL
jgi:hypothetical protein